MASSNDLAPFQGPYFKQLLRSQRLRAPRMTTDVGGQTGIIIGGNGGVALDSVHILLRYGISRLILTVRNPQKFEPTIASLRKSYPSSAIDAWVLDLQSYSSIEAFVDRCKTLDRIDFVNISAGIILPNFTINEATRHEVVFQVNYLSTVYLALLLLPVLRERHPPKKPSILTMVSSGLAYVATFPEQKAPSLFAAFDDPKNWSTSFGGDRYSTAKLMLLMFLVKVKDYANPDEVVVNVTDPGFMRAVGLDQHMPLIARFFVWLLRVAIGRSAEDGAMTFVDATVVKGKESHGSFLYNWKIAPFPASMYQSEGRSLIDKVWDETLHELEFARPQDILNAVKGKTT
ncbi:hypothetical protein JX266_010928 [Neoarthrinium moseri]|nr:hypothetical protein JX266_010928 [Neoarthrinium moseri]